MAITSLVFYALQALAERWVECKATAPITRSDQPSVGYLWATAFAGQIQSLSKGELPSGLHLVERNFHSPCGRELPPYPLRG